MGVDIDVGGDDLQFARLIATVVTTISIVLRFSKRANPGLTGKMAVKTRETAVENT